MTKRLTPNLIDWQLDPGEVASFNLFITGDDAPVVTVEMIPPDWGKAGVEDLVLKRLRLVEIEEEG